MKTRTHTFTGRLSKAAHGRLESFLEQQRQLWNAALQERQDAYKKQGISITLYDQYKSLTAIRSEYPEFEQYMAVAQRTVLNRLDKACKAFFRRVRAGEKPGHPRFMGRSRTPRSLEMPCPGIVTTEKGVHSFAVKGLGRFRFRGDLPEGEYKTLRIVKTPRRVNVQLVAGGEVEIAPDNRDPIGIDVGVKAQAALSNGHKEPKNIVDRTELKRLQKILSRAKRGSNSREKKRQAVAREHQRVRDREHGRTHELTSRIIKNHSANICIEKIKQSNLTRKGGTKKKGLNRAIYEQQWGKIKQQLTYKAENAGGFVVEVDPKNTSQMCAACGGMPSERLGLDVRRHVCGHCKYEADRDVNAARNIRQKGLIEASEAGREFPGAWGKCGSHMPTRKPVGFPTTQKDVSECLGT